MSATSVLVEGERASLSGRVGRLTPASPAKWGRMDAGQMLRHTAEALRMALGELPVRPAGKRFFHARLVKYLMIRVLPFPKGAPTAPELRVAEPVAFEAERARWLGLLSRFGSAPPSGVGAEHPLFGPLTWQEWGELQYKHLDHHLKQFGV